MKTFLPFISFFREEARVSVFTTEFIQHVVVGNDAWERLSKIGSFTLQAADSAFEHALRRVDEAHAGSFWSSEITHNFEF